MAENFPQQLQAALGPSFAIERELGGGGMSRVYLVADAALARRIVVKILPPDLGGRVNAERFRREIQIAAGLQHPCIVPVLTTGVMDGIPYYTMPFVAGESLRTRLRSGQLIPVSRAVRIVRDVASATAHAHEHGVAHRDLKPDNVLLSSGYAVVTDFGVAKAVSSARNGDDVELTTRGMTVGTPAYMAPEQATADPAADHRVDVYALGVMAYEIFAGHRPFAGKTAQELLVAHITKTPPDLADRRPDLSASLARLVMRCLAKSADDRPGAAEIVEALDAETAAAVSSGSSTPVTGPNAVTAALPSVAVLPFVNLTGNADNDYLADGIAEEILNALARLRTMHVAARSSSFAFRGPSVDVRAVGEKLGVRSVLEGSVRRSGNRFRVTVQLVDVASGFQLWSERYDREVDDVFEIEEKIAGAVVDTLKVTLLHGRHTMLAPRRTQNLEAYKLYLRGRFSWNQTGAGFERALDLFEQALELDPEFALAHAGVADVFIAAGIFETMPPSEAFPLARTAADRARAIDDSVPEVHAALGAINLFHDWDFAAARTSLERAVALNPSNVTAYTWLTIYHAVRGQPDTALEWARRAIQLDPLAAPAAYSELFALYTARRYPEAVECANRVLTLNPAYAEGYRSLGWCLLALGKHEEAFDALRQAVKLAGSYAWASASLAAAHASLGDFDEAERLLRHLEEQAEQEWISPLTLGVVYLALGRTEDALACVERSYEARDCWVISLAVEPVWAPLRGAPRFEAVIDRVSIEAPADAASALGSPRPTVVA
ncbi:MAG TPA: protein kinase [Gemmatimonadaceae bacterium]|nr:protein kinase [Gemmatimonadaceae bacterium]